MRVSIDSRTIQPGDYFIPVKGPHFDGRNFIEEALAKGGRLLDVDLTDYAKKYRKKLSCHVIGITGSAGKTTVKDMLKSVLSQKFNVVATKENHNNEVGVPLTLLSADEDTEILIVEMAMRGKGEIKHLTRLVRPTHVVVTGIGLSHVGLFKRPKDIAMAKAEIFQKSVAWEQGERYAFINYASNFHELLCKKAEASEYHVLPFEGQDKPEQNLNLCYAVGRHFGLTDEEVQAGIQSYLPSSHRLTRVPHPKVTLVDDTYNANPDGMLYAFQFLRRFPGRKVVVLGDMLELGEYSKDAHQALVPALIDAQIDVVFTYGDEMQVLESNDLSLMHFQSKDEMHHVLKDELKSGDVVLVKGSRGLKMEETVDYIREHII